MAYLFRNGQTEPIFRKRVVEPHYRRAQCDRVKRARANGRVCWVFRTEAHYDACFHREPPAEPARLV
jgi:hypothetical protein